MKKNEILSYEFRNPKKTKSKDGLLAIAYLAVIDNKQVAMIDIKCIKDVIGNRNKIFHQKKDMFRVCISKNEWINYDFQNKTWNQRKLSTFILGKIDFEEGSIDAIEKITSYRSGFYSRESRIIEDAQEEINKNKYLKQNDALCKKREEKISEIMKDVPEILVDFYKFADEITNNFHAVFFNKDGIGICSNCGKEVQDIWSAGSSQKGSTCPECGELIECHWIDTACRRQSYGKKNPYTSKKYTDIVLIQKFRDGYILRYFGLEKSVEIRNSELCEDTFVGEYVREFHTENKVFKHYNIVSNYTGETFWHDKNLSGMRNVLYGKAILYKGTLGELKGTELEYAALDIMADKKVEFNISNFVNYFPRNQYLEFMIKYGMTKLVAEGTMKQISSLGLNYRAKNATEIMRISKSRINRLIQLNGGLRTLFMLQNEEATGKSVSDETILKIEKDKINIDSLRKIRNHISIEKAMKLIYSNKEYSTINQTIIHYADYIEMAAELEYNMTSEFVLYPRDLKNRHDVAVEIRKSKDSEIKANKYKAIEAMQEWVNKSFGYENNEYLLRAPADALEIIKEGQELHHCVGGDTYLLNMAKKKSFILFLRQKADIEKPYYTVEITKSGLIKQYYGYLDKQPDKKEIDTFLSEYMNEMSNKVKITISA